ncbi:MAG: trypsin-like serine protease [Solirubrobacterales bacterium]
MLAFVFLALAPAHALSIPVYELGGGGPAASSAGQPLLVPGRPPASRFDGGQIAGASSIHVARSKAAGTRTNGKILGVDHYGSGYSCSGTALNTPSRSIVITAGHCVMERGARFKRIIFVPAYNHGRRPFGSFEAEAIYVMPPWRRSENPDFDVAALKVKPTSAGALTDVVGGRGYATSKSRRSDFEIFGYPAAALRGEELRSCRATGLGMDFLTNIFFGPPTVPAACDMAAGSSGGSWIIKGEYVNGVTSYSYAKRSTARLYSPYFGPSIANFLRELP